MAVLRTLRKHITQLSSPARVGARGDALGAMAALSSPGCSSHVVLVDDDAASHCIHRSFTANDRPLRDAGRSYLQHLRGNAFTPPATPKPERPRRYHSSTSRLRASLLRGPLMPLLLLVLTCALLYTGLIVALWLQEAQTRWRPVEGAGGGKRESIPKIIHQMYAVDELPERWRDTPERWRTTHPDYEYKFWTDATLRHLIATEYPWLLATYDAYPHDTQRWDASRYAILHKCVRPGHPPTHTHTLIPPSHTPTPAGGTAVCTRHAARRRAARPRRRPRADSAVCTRTSTSSPSSASTLSSTATPCCYRARPTSASPTL